MVCRGENPLGMKFCRSCGNALQPSAAGSPVFGGSIGRPGPMPAPVAPPGPLQGIPPGPIGGSPVRGVPAYGPIGGVPGGRRELDPTEPPSPLALGMMSTNLAAAPLSPLQARPQGAPQGGTTACPRCGTQTPLGFAYCQQCGFQLQAAPVSEAPTNIRPRNPSSAPPIAARLDKPIDPHAGTIAQDGPGAALIPARAASAPRPQPAASWGTAVLVNRDGTDGQRYSLAGEYLVFGRAGADIAFDDDRFLAWQHARIERGADGIVTIHALDTLNGVFRKTDAPVELVDGSVILIGREVLRYERVDPQETKGQPLVRHGVALFGSPPRDPWGRFVQLVPSGGYRDVRHLAGDEIVLGREEGDIVFRDDAFMSRRHAAVTWDGRRAQITDLGSSNGTFIRLTAPCVLKHGDHVRMGDQLLRLELGR